MTFLLEKSTYMNEYKRVTRGRPGPMFAREKCEATEYNEMIYGIYFISNILLGILLQTVIDININIISSAKNNNCC